MGKMFNLPTRSQREHRSCLRAAKCPLDLSLVALRPRVGGGEEADVRKIAYSVAKRTRLRGIAYSANKFLQRKMLPWVPDRRESGVTYFYIQSPLYQS